jgi:hypothetical protein
MKQDLLDLFLRANEKEIPQKPAIENFPKVKAIKFVRELLYKRNSTNEPFMRVTDIEGKLKAEMSLLSAKEFTEQFMDFIEQFITVKYSN